LFTHDYILHGRTEFFERNLCFILVLDLRHYFVDLRLRQVAPFASEALDKAIRGDVALFGLLEVVKRELQVLLGQG